MAWFMASVVFPGFVPLKFIQELLAFIRGHDSTAAEKESLTGFVTGPDFSRAANYPKLPGFSPCAVYARHETVYSAAPP
jgi:hypothetical protein